MKTANDLLLVPQPRRTLRKEGSFRIPGGGAVRCLHEAHGEWEAVLLRACGIISSEAGLELSIAPDMEDGVETILEFLRDPALGAEAYRLEIGEAGIRIHSADGSGGWHALSTLKQIVQQAGEALPLLTIEDAPDFPVRGLMLDISRNKVPEMKTLYRVVDIMTDLKMNHLQLYIEGFSFAYPSFPQVWSDRTPMTGEDFDALDRYCAERRIDLVPNQNSFGHMTPWLSRPEFGALAECEDGYEAPWGHSDQPMSLNPLDDRTFEFLERTYDDLLPHFRCDYFNVGCDETFDLGQGKSREACERLGKGRVYLNYLLRVEELVRSRGKKMMFWGDIIKEHPELVPELPKDIIALEWGYSADQPSESQCERYARAGVPYCVCPGTSSWNAVTGLVDNMKQNIRNAAEYGLKHGAHGIITTDWGDAGHWQPLPATYPGLVYGAALAWGVQSNWELDIGEALTRFVFRDRNGRMGKLAVDFGNYYKTEQASNFNGSTVFRTLYYHQLDDTNRTLDFLELPDPTANDFNNVAAYLAPLVEDLSRVELLCEDGETVVEEYRYAARLILHGVHLGLLKCADWNGREQERNIGLARLDAELTSIMEEFRSGWLKRNRSGGMEESLVRLRELQRQYRAALEGGDAPG